MVNSGLGGVAGPKLQTPGAGLPGPRHQGQTMRLAADTWHWGCQALGAKPA